jgi:predicted N-acetyltransferase YhbS
MLENRQIEFQNTNIRLATVNDLQAISALVNSGYRGDESKKGWTTEADYLDGIRTSPDLLKQSFEAEGTYFLVYEEVGKIVGSVCLENKPDFLYLGMLTVNPNLQNAGIGGALIAEAEAFAKFFNLHKIKILVLSQRHELIAYYERKAFYKTGATAPFPMDNPDFGIPKVFLEFIEMEKLI